MIQTNIFSKGRPLTEYLKKQVENRKFVKSLETSGTFALITFFLFFAIRPTALTISALIGEINAKEKMISEMKGKISDLVLAQDAFSQVQERYGVINSALPDNPDYRQSMVQMVSAAKESGITLDKLSYNLMENPKNSPFPTQLEFYTVAISRKTSYASALDIIDKLLHNRRLISLKSVRIGSAKDDTDTTENSSSDNLINVSFTNEIYYWKKTQNEK
ncbi:MAG: hypothetical protein WC841_00370 [Candidatus Shapirobacteria bacterium]|jgi:hypothetical protein